ncbi:mitotic-spindle organizing protein 2A [Trichonephila clavipes]|uniref:Mitotic-spindle organizing protein 2A n=1 Tax=Trichonephila clavipes TaxID=2585209 RepID=A0A8X6RNE0_TRICX|nr:mitotic-spindle organizing protein 2A [Trichonephila clavipes]
MACERKLLESEATTGFFVLLGTKGKKETLEWCMKANLIASRYECPRCKKEMRLQKRKGTVDGYEWRCRSQSKDNPHDIVRSVRKGTWFSESKLAITITLRLTRYWFGKSMNAFVVNDDLTVTSWWMTIFMNSLHPSQGCIHQRNMTKCKRKKNNLIREFGTQVNPAEIHLQLSKTEKTSKEIHIEYFYRVKEIASRINMEEESEKYYIIRGLKENRAIEILLQSCSNIEELKEKMKHLDIQEKSKSSKNEVIYPKYPVTRLPHHTNQFARRQQYGGWNWRNDQSQHPDAITGSRYNVYSPQFLSPSYHHPSYSLQRPILYRNQRFPQRPTVLRPNAPTFNPRQRTQNNNTVFQPHQTGELIIIQGRINFKQVDVLLDTGSSVNIIPKNIISQIKEYHNVEYIKTKIATINGEIEVSEAITLQLKKNRRNY